MASGRQLMEKEKGKKQKKSRDIVLKYLETVSTLKKKMGKNVKNDITD